MEGFILAHHFSGKEGQDGAGSKKKERSRQIGQGLYILYVFFLLWEKVSKQMSNYPR